MQTLSTELITFNGIKKDGNLGFGQVTMVSNNKCPIAKNLGKEITGVDHMVCVIYGLGHGEELYRCKYSGCETPEEDIECTFPEVSTWDPKKCSY